MPPETNQAPLADRSFARLICVIVLLCFVALFGAQAIVLPISGRYLLPWHMWVVAVAFAGTAFAMLTGRHPMGSPVVVRRKEPPER